MLGRLENSGWIPGNGIAFRKATDKKDILFKFALRISGRYAPFFLAPLEGFVGSLGYKLTLAVC